MAKYKSNKSDIEKVESWTAPEKIDGPDPRILTMSNVPDSLHGQAPRTILGNATWTKMRKRCYYDADYTCEACGEDLHDKLCHAHELYSYDFVECEAKFERCVCLCPRCHLLCIHTGRALSLYRKHNPMYQEKQLLDGAEHSFKLISEWNKNHPDDEPLKPYSTFVSYIDEPRLREPMEKLIEKYSITFYSPVPSKKEFGAWRLKIGNKWYDSKYKSREEWQKAMNINNKTVQETNDRLKGSAFDRIMKLMEEGENGNGD